MNKQLEQTIVRQIKKHRYKSGAYCLFIPIGRIGIKFYNEKKDRDWAYMVQKYAALFSFAPNCWNMFETKNQIILEKYVDEVWHSDRDVLYDTRKLYGFVTQRARMVYNKEDYRPIQKNRDKIHKDLNKIGIKVNDMHEGNYGRLNGRLVCIDFDPEAVFLENEESVRADVFMS